MPNSFKKSTTSVCKPVLSDTTNTSPPSWTNLSNVSVSTRSFAVVGRISRFWYRLYPFLNSSRGSDSGPTSANSGSRFLSLSISKSFEYCDSNSGRRVSYTTSVLESSRAEDSAQAKGVRRNKRKIMD
ncbi:hypothetical protein OGATHE_005798 [Ogataea polymorpha]|uniref:Uncharacterized protein n=1 Tax=Ogataea polymorpha TaxID=460523 RepID=A0A9P8NSV3_9ASCO|nr:hypothetical protein OGATHE_005798 [Ogataea polymorpha]